MQKYSDQALVLRRYPFGESDEAIAFLSRQHGLFRAIGKGVARSKKRFGGCLDLFQHVKLTVTQKNDESPRYLHEASLINAFLGLRQSYEKIWYASFFADSVLQMIDEDSPDADESEYLLLGSAYQWLATGSDESNAWVATVFFLQWFGLQGLLPSLEDLTGLFQLQEEEERLFQEMISIPLSRLISREGWQIQKPPVMAAKWFDALMRWAAKEHSFVSRLPTDLVLRLSLN